ncbi:DMT family transporter [Salinicola rhizosphaerae]|uniref:Multidrug SMR transporter n=1 Tax=Salinicola rhizosphaerae TaxID=1443141 RepID=A0ABQ3EBD1_9GAMM|nr:multidrug efflux SMR transporter [Salinicola rhizosphaerae]GHB32335.1 multidrug SMR transporter [Salinicola rhizosphaerae]
MSYLLLALAILAEVIATTSLKASAGFSRPLPSVIVVLGYAFSFYALSLVLRTLPVGITYAIWAGLGIVLVTLIGIFVYGEKPDFPALLGMGLIIAGVGVIQIFSRISSH